MAFLALKLLLLIFMILSATVKAQFDQSSFHLMTTEALEWPWTMSAYDDELGGDEDQEDSGVARRSLYRKAKHYYISYGALSANRIPCPPRSGRSYYTHNCHRANEAVNPYSRGCSRITYCR
ncbi:Rapid ALkalinization Factor [Melia azedarach]|uniref:Rapid ALkalinization Factor n=1 Tax=Melia azedarach TaxID=155640 RepID=A0ACC1WRB2_MELAZ|nr:Rapid ALkalinization Factor [Melia azedarach]